MTAPRPNTGGSGAKKTSVALGRSWLAGEVSLAEVRKLTKSFKASAELFDEDAMNGSIYDVVVVDGPLHVRGDFSTFAHKLCGLVVAGELSIEGHYSDTDDPNTGVFVLGSMTARSVFTNGSLNVKGDLDAGDGLIGFYNDFSADIYAVARARTSSWARSTGSSSASMPPSTWCSEHHVANGPRRRSSSRCRARATPTY